MIEFVEAKNPQKLKNQDHVLSGSALFIESR